jgi:hypothetical protein
MATTTEALAAAIHRFCCACNGSTAKSFPEDDCESRDCHLFLYRPGVAPKKTQRKTL